MARNQQLTYPIGDADEERAVASKWAICGQCDGHGASSAYMGAFTREDMDQQGPDFMEDYMAGRFDRECERCEGAGKVLVPDYARMSAEDAKAYREHVDDMAELDAMHEAERRFGC